LTYSAPALGTRIVWKAKVDKINELEKKYKEFMKFIQYIDSEENAL
jgi:hypothetical protein